MVQSAVFLKAWTARSLVLSKTGQPAVPGVKSCLMAAQTQVPSLPCSHIPYPHVRGLLLPNLTFGLALHHGPSKSHERNGE